VKRWKVRWKVRCKMGLLSIFDIQRAKKYLFESL